MSLPTRARRFAANRSGVAATEFVLATPIVMMLMLGCFDLGRFALDTQRVELVANEVGEIVAQAMPSSNPAPVQTGDGVLTDSQIENAQQAAMFIFPQALSAATQQGVFWTSILKVNISSVKFTATPTGCTTSCSYVPSVVWTTGNRPCSTTFTAVSNAAVPAPASLPLDVYSANSLVVVDVTYAFKPTFGAQYLGAVTVARSYYITPRNVPIVETTSSSSVAPLCSGALHAS